MIQPPFCMLAKGGLFIKNCRIVLHMENWPSAAWYHNHTKVRLWGALPAIRLGFPFKKTGKHPGCIRNFYGIIQ